MNQHVKTFQVLLCFTFSLLLCNKSYLLCNGSNKCETKQKTQKWFIELIHILFLHSMSKFQPKSIKTHGWDKKHVYEKWQFFAKICQNFAKTWIFCVFILSFCSAYVFSDFRHHWHGFSEIMTQKSTKISSSWTPNFPNKSKKTVQLQGTISRGTADYFASRFTALKPQWKILSCQIKSLFWLRTPCRLNMSIQFF